jgi:hypothetical protein
MVANHTIPPVTKKHIATETKNHRLPRIAPYMHSTAPRHVSPIQNANEVELMPQNANQDARKREVPSHPAQIALLRAAMCLAVPPKRWHQTLNPKL